MATPQRTDVVIIGGGITGLLSAYLLSKEGKKVTVLEKGEIGRESKGATAYTTAFVTNVIDTLLVDLIKIHGEAGAKLIVDSHKNAIDLITRIVAENAIECSFVRCSNYEYANYLKEYSRLQKEHEAAQKLGLKTSLHSKLQGTGAGAGAAVNLGFENCGYLEFHDQAKIDPFPFLESLAKICSKQGVDIHTGREAKSITSPDGGKTVRVSAGDLELVADYAIVATYKPFNNPDELRYKTVMYTSYVYMFETPTGVLKEGLYEDTNDPYHYFRVDRAPRPAEGEGKNDPKARDTVLIGGEDHRADIHITPTKNYTALKRYLETIFRNVSYRNLRRWSGPILEPIDGLAFIGSFPHEKNIFYATAFSGNGMTYSAIAAQIFADTIAGRDNPYAQVYRADREIKTKSFLIKGRDFTKELIGGAVKNMFKKGEEDAEV